MKTVCHLTHQILKYAALVIQNHESSKSRVLTLRQVLLIAQENIFEVLENTGNLVVLFREILAPLKQRKFRVKVSASFDNTVLLAMIVFL